MLAAMAAPAFVRASSLMPGRVLEQTEGGIVVPTEPKIEIADAAILSPPHGLKVGDRFTIKGLGDIFYVTAISRKTFADLYPDSKELPAIGGWPSSVTFRQEAAPAVAARAAKKPPRIAHGPAHVRSRWG